MKKFLFVLLCAVSFGSAQSIAQNSFEAKIIGEVPIGSSRYYLALSSDGYSIYKTSVFVNATYNVEDIINLVETYYEHFDIENSNGAIAYLVGERNQGSLNSLIFEDLPYLSNDILFFRDQNHLESTYNQIMHLDSIFADFEYEDISTTFESQFSGFKSFRFEIISEFGDLENDGITDEDMIELEDFDFIGDYILKSLFSKYRLIGIDDRVYFYNYLNEIISVDINDSSAIQHLKDVSVFGRFDMTDQNTEIRHSNRYRYDMTDLNLTIGRIDWSDTIQNNRAIIMLNGDEALTSEPEYSDVENCNVKKFKLRIPLFYYWGLSGAASYFEPLQMGSGTTLVINWGDGISQTINNYDGVTWIEHTFADYGTYDIETSIYWGQYTFVDVYQHDADIDCGSGDRANWKHTDVGNYRLRSKIWINQNVFGKHVGSYTHAYQKDGNNWKQIKANIYTSINGTFRDEVCVIKDQKQGSNSKSNKKEVQVTKTKLFARVKSNSSANSDVTSTHSMVKNGVTITANMSLIICP